VENFDADGNGWLDTAERDQARQSLGLDGGGGARGGRGGGRGGRGVTVANPTPGVRLTESDVQLYGDEPLYDPAVLRTLFIDFENPDWEAELVAFNNTDVDVPATVRVDGKTYEEVGIHFRGNSSFSVGNGRKRSLNLTFDFLRDDQSLGGYRTLNLLNAHGDPSLLRTVLAMHIARQYIPSPKANLVRVVINGENWGIYTNVQQFNKDLLQDEYDTTKGTRWKVPQGGGRGGAGGFAYLNDNPTSYQGTFEIKSKDDPEAWEALINLARTLAETPTNRLEAALEPILDIDGYLRFLALDNAMSSGDGFYTRVADYNLYLDPDGRFHFLFHDTNEMFSTGGGGGPGGGGGVRLNPLTSANDSSKPIISKILAVPALREKYLGYVRDIAETWLDWDRIGPVVAQYRELIADDVARETRGEYSYENFLRDTSDASSPTNLRSFMEQRRAYLLSTLP